MSVKTEILREREKAEIRIIEMNECEQEKVEKNNAVLPLVSNSALQDNSKLVDNMCMSYRHDFGLMAEQDKQALRFECKEWLRAYENNREHCC